MGVYIKGMEMPTSCLECRLFNDPWCMAKNRNQWRTAYNRPPKGERQNDCPLIEIPPHGDLIENSVIKKAINDACAECKEACIEFDGFFADCNQCIFHDVKKALVDAPTIIEAEEVYGQYTDTAGNYHWCGVHSGEHTIKAEEGEI